MGIRRLLLAMCCAAMCSTSFAQPAGKVTVHGVVTASDDGAPIPAAAVLQAGGGASAETSADGRYEIVVPEGAVLEFSSLGMVTRRIPCGKGGELNVALDPDVSQLGDVLVVAYGTSRKDSFTGSAEVVNADKLRDKPVTEVTKMLDGQVAGVMTTSGSGQPGSGAEIRIRGFGSVNASNAPLIVVDGVPFDGNLNALSSSDIESVSVLKDASAGALYGARGANGVILVTTRRAKAGDEHLEIGLSAKFGVLDRAIPLYETVDAREYMGQMYNACYNDLVHTEGYLPAVAKAMTPAWLSRQILGTDAVYNPFDKPVSELFLSDGQVVPEASLKWDESWMDEVKARLPMRQEYQLSVSGATGNARYMASGSYLDEEGTLKTTGFTRYTLRTGVDITPKDWLEMGTNISYAYTDSRFLGASGSTNSNIWYSAMMMAPIYPVYVHGLDGSLVTENGEKVFDYGSSRPAGAQNNRNSVATLFDDDYRLLSSQVSARSHVGLKWNGFSLTTSLGLDDNTSLRSTKYNRNNGNAAGTGRLNKENGTMLSYTWNQLLGYKKDFGGHGLDLMAGHEFYRYAYRYLVGERTSFSFDDFDELAMGSTLADGNSVKDLYAIDSWLSRLNYDYADKYYFSASARRDASSRFQKDHRWGLFWSLGASWRISQEPFLQGADWLDNLTLKASYGVQGNDNLGSYYAWQSLYYMGFPNAAYSGAVISSLENRDVTWEKNANFNTGVEFRLLNRIWGTFEWYSRKTSDMLLDYPMALSLGFDGYYANVGSIRNSGLDLTLAADVVSTKDLTWNVTAMASTVHNKVLHLTGQGSDDIINGVYLIREGEELNTFYMARSAGVDPATGDQLYWAYEKDASGVMVPGSEYVTAQTTAASASKYKLGSRIPDVYGSLSTTLRWKRFDASALFTWSLGGKVFDSVYEGLMNPTFVGQAYHRNALRAWTTPGEVTDVPRATTVTSDIITDRFLIDASYLAVKSLSVGYSLKETLARKAGLSSARVFLAADSPWIFTHLKGMNPQASFSGSTSYSYTPTRSLTLGFDLKF